MSGKTGTVKSAPPTRRNSGQTKTSHAVHKANTSAAMPSQGYRQQRLIQQLENEHGAKKIQWLQKKGYLNAFIQTFTSEKNNRYEQEAEATASKVVANQPVTKISRIAQGGQTQPVNRQLQRRKGDATLF